MIRWLDEIPPYWASRDPARLALADAHGDRSWGSLEAARLAWATRLEQLGVRPGDRVMVVGENGALTVALLFAIATRRAWITNVNARLSGRELDMIRAHAGARVALYLLESPDAAAHAKAAGAAAFESDGWGPVAATAVDDGVSPEAVSDDPAQQVAALLYTTGTTGDPKGVMLTHANILFIARTARELRGITEADRVYGLLPMSHVYGLASVCFGTLISGASLHFQPRFQPAAMAEFVRGRGLTVCQGVPAMWSKVVEYLRSRGEKSFGAPALRFLYAGGSPLSPALKQDVEAFFELPLHNGYGLTEASPTLTQTRPAAPRADCSVGPAVPGVELRIVDREGGDVPEGEIGELWARGPNIMKGYYRSPAATAEALREGGWLATGDLARRDAEGYYYIEGRLKELIIRSGFNVHPAEVEAVLCAHPEVTLAAVVGRAVDGDEEVVAFVELAPGARATPAELAEFAGRSLAPYKRPAEVIVLEALPAAANGKVLKGRLAQMAREARAAR